MFSSRLKWETDANSLTRLLKDKQAGGAEILDLTESNPTHADLAYPREKLLSAFQGDERILQYEPDPRGLLSAREAVSEYYAERGFDADPARIILTASTSEAYSYLFKLLCNPGDIVLTPRPSYPLFEYLAAAEGVKVKQYPLRYDGAWHVDFAALKKLITGRVKAIAVVNPNNPTGSFLKRNEREELDALALKKGLAILSDEVFSDYSFTTGVTTSLVDGARALTFSMSGLSKIAGLPQMKLGWIVAGGDQHNKALEGLEWIADTFLSVSTPVQVGLRRLLAAGDLIRAEIQQRTKANLEFLRGQHPILLCEGGWNAVMQIPRTHSEEEWAMSLLKEDNVRVHPGYFYDFESEAYLVLSLLSHPLVFREGVKRIVQRIS